MKIYRKSLETWLTKTYAISSATFHERKSNYINFAFYGKESSILIKKPISDFNSSIFPFTISHFRMNEITYNK